MLLKGEILPILSCFLFLFDEGMMKYWYPRKTIQGQKYIKLANIATLNSNKYFKFSVKESNKTYACTCTRERMCVTFYMDSEQ